MRRLRLVRHLEQAEKLTGDALVHFLKFQTPNVQTPNRRETRKWKCLSHEHSDLELRFDLLGVWHLAFGIFRGVSCPGFAGPPVPPAPRATRRWFRAGRR